MKTDEATVTSERRKQRAAGAGAKASLMAFIGLAG